MIDELAATPMSKVMHADPALVPPTMPVGDVILEMKDRHGAVLVVEGHKPVGIFTERDLMKRLDHSSDAWRRIPVGDVMTRSMRTLAPTDTISRAVELMSQGVFRHVPIIDGEIAVGMVSIRDILRYAVEHFPREFINLPPGPNSEAKGRWGG